MKRWFTFKAVHFLLAVTFSFKVAFCASFFFRFINFISTIWIVNNTKIYFWHDEKYVLITTMIWELRLCFWCLNFVFSSDMEESAAWLGFFTPSPHPPPSPILATHVLKSTMAHYRILTVNRCIWYWKFIRNTKRNIHNIWKRTA